MTHSSARGARVVGIDVGAETIKVVELCREGDELVWTRRKLVEHGKEPGRALIAALRDFGWDDLSGACVVGRSSRLVSLPAVPVKQAEALGARFLIGDGEATVVSIGAHGFSVLELRESGVEVFRENSRCSQGTGNFLRQLVERFNLGIVEASELVEGVEEPALLSGRCPVILKTDMTHLANKGESRDRIIAGLYDAVCENVQVLIKPAVSPPRVLLIGGVSRSRRVREHFRRFLGRHSMQLLDTAGDDAVFADALGAARIAAERPARVPPLDRLLAELEPARMDRVASLASYLPQVRRMTRPALPTEAGPQREILLGFDIGSTGSKVVALDRESREVLWESYLNTNGDPVGAAQALLSKLTTSPASHHAIVAFGATGSGREIVGSLLTNCYGVERVYVLNEIAAHAEGALFYDRSVDTIFEIGGQDAKYIRLSEGRVVDAAMNEACSAGTGSFIEEQGKKFSGIESVVQLGEEALRADERRVARPALLGVHGRDHRRGGRRGCRGALGHRGDLRLDHPELPEPREGLPLGRPGGLLPGHALRFGRARHGGGARRPGAEVIVPPNPGTVGALGIALLGPEAPARDPGRRRSSPSASWPRRSCAARPSSASPRRAAASRATSAASIGVTHRGRRQKQIASPGAAAARSGTRAPARRSCPTSRPDPFREREELVAPHRSSA